MSPTSHSSSFSHARNVHADSLVPHQHHTPIRLQRAVDYYEQCMIKHEGISEFHSRAELLYNALNEGRPSITCIVPQPFLFYINGRRYIPDSYLLDGSLRRIIELKPGGKLDDAIRIPMEQYLVLQGMRFEVVSNESVYEREIEAENWLEIVRTLHIARDWETEHTELTVLEYLEQHPQCTLGDIVDPGDREGTFSMELALFRLMHRGVVQADLVTYPLDYDTEITQCI